MISRRGFLKTILAAAAAPAFVRYGSLMVPRQPSAGLDLASSFGVDWNALHDGDLVFMPERVLGVRAGNVLLTPAMITNRALAILEQELLTDCARNLSLYAHSSGVYIAQRKH